MFRFLQIIIITHIFCLSAFCQIVNKIDIRLSGKARNEKQNVIVLLKEQADISHVQNIHGKDAKATYVYNSLLNIASSSQIEITSLLKLKGIDFRSFYIVNMISLKADMPLIEEISALPSVEAVIEDSRFTMIEPIASKSKENKRGIEWNITQIGAPSVWALGFTGQNVVIGGQDTGYKWDHTVLKNKYRGWNGVSADHNYNWHDAIHTSTVVNPCGTNSIFPCDDNNHGTHTMGTMVGDDGAGNQIGVAPGAKWIGCRNMDVGYGTLSTYVECFEWFLAPYPVGSTSINGNPAKMPHVINNSWGCPTSEGCNTTNFPVMEAALNNLRNAGCVIVVSAGNDGAQGCGSVNAPPAIFSGSFSIGATSNTDALAPFSSRGAVTVDVSNRLKPNVSAPGVSVRSSIKDGTFASWNGTSMAGPHVAGMVALLISANPMLAGEVDKIEDIIEQTAIHFTSTQSCASVSGTFIPNNAFGYGRIDALAAINMALPSNYIPYVKLNNHILISNPSSGLILVSPNNTKYRITVDNSGSILKTVVMAPATGSATIAQSSLTLEQNAQNIILTSPNNDHYSLTLDNNGALRAVLLNDLPVDVSRIQTGDLYVDTGLKGIILKSPDNTCYLTNISNLGIVLTIPSICQN